KGRAQILQEKAELQVRDHERRRQNLKSKNAVARSVFEVARQQSIPALFLERAVYAVEHFHEIRTSAAARIEHVHVLVREAERQTQFLAEHSVNPFHHVLDDFGWRVPHAQLLAQLGVKGFEEGFIEVLDGVRFLESIKKRAAIDAVQNQSCPV